MDPYFALIVSRKLTDFRKEFYALIVINVILKTMRELKYFYVIRLNQVLQLYTRKCCNFAFSRVKFELPRIA